MTQQKIVLRAYYNQDAISSFDDHKGQVEIYEYDTVLEDDTGIVEYESYATLEQAQRRVDDINNHNYTWDDIPSSNPLHWEQGG